ncbi:MAG: tetratricopeptide repeat protein [Acidobacteriota bacterium]
MPDDRAPGLAGPHRRGPTPPGLRPEAPGDRPGWGRLADRRPADRAGTASQPGPPEEDRCLGQPAFDDADAVSPLWTSMATGKTPIEHGIIDFLVRDPASGRTMPITSSYRKAKALWNIFTDAGLTSDFIAWWATWPAESIRGHMISDRLAYTTFGFRSGPAALPAPVSPPEYLETAASLRVKESAITLSDLHRFAPFTAAEMAAARARLEDDPSQAFGDPLNHLVRVLAGTRTYHTIARSLLERHDQDFLSIYYQGIDEVCHRYAQFIPPRLDWVDEDAFRKFRHVVTRFYEYQDELIGELLDAAGPDVTVMVVSDHGFLNGSDRPDYPPNVATKAGGWHRRYGILILAGPGIRPGPLEVVSIYDVTPTLLYLMGLPVAADMGGRPILDAVTAAFKRRVPLARIRTYGDRPGARRGPSASRPSAMDDEILARLRSLGYISPAGSAPPRGGESSPADSTLNNLFNAATLQLRNGETERSEASVRTILRQKPDHPESHTLLSEILETAGRADEALAEALTALNLTKEPTERLVERYARLARSLGRSDEAEAFFLRYAQLRPGRGEPWLGLGLLQSFSRDYATAERSFLRALQMNPRSRGAVTGLHNVYERGGHSPETLARIERAVADNTDSAAHHTLLGLIYTKDGRTQQAEAQLRRALELEPDLDSALAGLGDVLVATGRLPEARRLLEKALGRNKDQAAVRMALGRVYAKLGQLGEATRQMSEASRIEPSSASAQAQLGMLLMMQSQPRRSIPHVVRALELDPGLYELRLHLAVMYHDLERFDECEQTLKGAIAERPDDPEPHKLLASLYQETGRPAEAQREMKRLQEVRGGS